MVHSKSALLAFSVAALLSGGLASADTVTATLGNTSTGLSPGTDLAVNVTFNGGALSAAFIGQINWFNAVVTPSLSYPDNQYLTQALNGASFSTYCIEGTEDVYFSSPASWDGVVGLANAPETAPSLTNTFFTAAQISDLNTFWNNNYDSIGSDNSLATAFQLGIWEIVSANDKNGIALDNGGSNFLSAGDFQASNGSNTTAVGQANTWLTDLKTETNSGKYNLYALVKYGTQDQIFAVQAPTIVTRTVPLPAALPAGLSLLGGLALFNFRKRRRTN